MPLVLVAKTSIHMSDTSLGRLEGLFLFALQQPHHSRSAWVQSVCGNDSRLRERLNSLLATHDADGSFILDHPIQGNSVPGDKADKRHIEPCAGDQLGPYILLRQIGVGGMGVVFLAFETEPIQRVVALKLLRLGLQTTAMLRQFACERQSLALMQHPAIPRIFNAGKISDDREFLAMEYFDGQNIKQFCQQRTLSAIDCVALFVKVCEAVEYIHRRGVVHRDIKPSNVLVIVVDGVPEPRLIDFGIATANRTAGERLESEYCSSQVFGSVDYMSPEQSHPDDGCSDSRSDIYSLGALLYELITQTTPFSEWKHCSLKQRLAVLREETPTSLKKRLQNTSDRKRAVSVTEQLNQITMKCLNREPVDRYQTAGELVGDLRCCLKTESVIAENRRGRKRGVSRSFGVSAILTLLVIVGAMMSDQHNGNVGIDVVRTSQPAPVQSDAIVGIPLDAYEEIDLILRENGVETRDQTVVLQGNSKASHDPENTITLVQIPATNSALGGPLVSRQRVADGHSG